MSIRTALDDPDNIQSEFVDQYLPLACESFGKDPNEPGTRDWLIQKLEWVSLRRSVGGKERRCSFNRRLALSFGNNVASDFA